VDKMSKNQLDKLKQWFKSSKSSNSQDRYALIPELERELRKESPIEKRIKLLKDLNDVVIHNRLEEVSFIAIH
jgi:transcriptional/translational regulatory protein YebC/TACO1